ncbi:MAG TPA: type I-E CRISPR-associated protein Cse1/CasA [Anaerohalosphaeraceae bacterium]|nr:type I-E CRISPR-associated protein Cse1/CasA [Anaerohalosphaeraceae bacterium]
MDHPLTQGTYNLLEEKWIPVLYVNGKTERVGIWQALTDAHKIRQIAASNPMDRVALLRFLMAVLMWCKEDAKDALLKIAGISEDWLTKLKEHKTAFDLFDKKQPFMQDLTVKGEKANAATELIHDLPSGSALNHFRHTRDKVDGLCPACCAIGLIRWSCYATAGTKGRSKSMPASLNGNTPAYAFPVCNTLLQCLGESLKRLTTSPNDTLSWLSNNRPDKIGPLIALTWRSRSVLLTMPTENDGMSCSYCGANTGGLIREIRFQPGWRQIDPKQPGDADPHLVKGPVSYPSPNDNDSVEHSAMLWRNLMKGVFKPTDTYPINSVPHDVVVLGSVQALLKHCEMIRVKPVEGAVAKRVELTKHCADTLRFLVKSATLNQKTSKNDHQEINAAVVLLTPDTEAQIQTALEQTLPTEQNDSEADKKFLREIYEPLVEQIVASTVTGSPLHRRAAKERALALLNKKIDELVEKMDHLSTADSPGTAPAKKKRIRKKGDTK